MPTEPHLRISVVIPVRNDAPMLAHCLQALKEQHRAPDEVVVVDNDSEDHSAELAARFGARVVMQPRIGIPSASATGYDASTGDIIARIDADSRPHPTWLQQVERQFLEHPETDFVTGSARFYGSTPLVHWVARNLYIGGMYAALWPALGHPPLFGSNMAMRAEAWAAVRERVNRHERGIHDDLDLTLHVPPHLHVAYNGSLEVRVSARPFESWSALKRRLSWVLPTIRLYRQHETLRARRLKRRQAARHCAPTSQRTARFRMRSGSD